MSNTKLDGGLLLLGLTLVGASVALKSKMTGMELDARVLTALGGGLIGTAIPGVLRIRIKGMRAVGGLALVVLFFLWGGESKTTNDRASTGEAKPNPIPPNTNLTNSPQCIGNNCKQDVLYDQRQQLPSR